MNNIPLLTNKQHLGANMKRSAICYLGLILSGNAFAGCDWATTTPQDDTKYKYLVAKSYSETSAADAANKAERDIDNQIGRLFGTALNVQSEFYSDTTTSAGTTRSYERSIGTISLKGLERQKSDVSKESGGWVGCVQYRYSQKEFKQEQQRLAKMPQSATNIVFNESAGDITCKGAPVEIITTPSKAFVTIDNGKYQGESPIKFGNVCNGKHTLEITKENYSDVSETLIVPTNGKISKTLNRGTKSIKIRTSLGDSRIFINDIDYGKEPVNFNAPFGVDQKITAKNSEAVDITRTVSFSKYSEPEYMFNMEKLPGKIDFSAFKVRNPGVEISVNGKTITGNSTGELSPDKKQELVFSKAGFFDIEKSLRINGGETTYYPSQELSFSKYPSTTTNFLLGAGVSFGPKNAGFNLDAGITAKIKYLYLGAGAQLNYLSLQKAKMEFDSIYNLHSSHHSAEINTEYYELLYSNLGINIGRQLSVFGIGTLGVLHIAADGSKTTNGHNVSDKNKTIFRYGIGMQYVINTIKDTKASWGIRASYLTGTTHLSPSDIQFTHPNKYNNDHFEFTNKEFKSYPDKIDSFNLTFFVQI